MSYWINEQQIKDNTYLDSNFTSKNILSAIIDAQKFYFESVLGIDFYSEIDSQIETDTLTPDNENLVLNFIRPALAKYVLYQLLPAIRLRVAQNGVNTPIAEGSTVPDRAEYFNYLNRTKAEAEEYMRRLKDELCNNSAKYPTYLYRSEYVNSIQSQPKLFW